MGKCLPVRRAANPSRGAGSAGVPATSLREVRIGAISVVIRVLDIGSDEVNGCGAARPDVDALGLRSGATRARR